MRSENGEYSKIHGCSNIKGRGRTKEYISWSKMKDRCYNKNNDQFIYYGGRGIIVCDRWRYSFVNFLADVGYAPTKNHSIDRFPDLNGNYEPGNVRWATPSEQCYNRRNCVKIEYNGMSLTASQFADVLKIPLRSVRWRLYNKWPIEKIINTPYIKRKLNENAK